MSYGLYEDADYPDHVTMSINGTAYGTIWDASGLGIDEGDVAPIDISGYLDPLQQNHTVVFACTGGQGEIEFEADMLVVVQAVILS